MTSIKQYKDTAENIMEVLVNSGIEDVRDIAFIIKVVYSEVIKNI